MKKSIVLLVLVILLVPSVPASRVSLEAGCSPFSYQMIAMQSSIVLHSDYGYGAKAGLTFSVGKFLLGGDFIYSDFRYSEFSDDYRILTLQAKAGISRDLTDGLSLDIFLNGGFDTRRILSESRTNAAFGAYVGLAYNVAGSFYVTAGTDLRFAFQLGPAYSDISIDLGVLGNLGLRVDI